MPEQLRLLDEASENSWDPDRLDLHIRESRRARRLILQVIPPQRLEIVVPFGTRPKDIQAFVAENQVWIKQARGEIAARFKGDRSERPAEIVFKSIARRFTVDYRCVPGRAGAWRGYPERVTITCPTPDYAGADRLLRAWLLRQAAVHLKPWLRAEAARVAEHPRRVQVRLQRTRWGSCSSQRNISLNASLLFLEPSLVRYLFVHELCHLRWLDHSRRYWRMVERFEPDYRRLDQLLGEAWSELPWWVIKARGPRMP